MTIAGGILFMFVLAATSYFTFKVDNKSDPGDFWGNVVNFIIAIILAIIVTMVIISAPIVLLGLAFVVIIVLLAILMESIRSRFSK